MDIIVDIKKDPRYQEGKAQRDFEIVLTMHRNGFKVATIQRITGLSLTVIEQCISQANI